MQGFADQRLGFWVLYAVVYYNSLQCTDVLITSRAHRNLLVEASGMK